MEIWKDIKGYEGLYQVSSLGRVKSLKREFYSGMNYQLKKSYPERILKKRYTKTGYVYVGLSKKGDVRKFKVHRLVAMAFLPNPHNKSCVDHTNGVRDDNRLENLRWVDASQNMRNPHTVKSVARAKMGENNPMKKKCRPVQQIDFETGKIIAEYAGVKEAARRLSTDSGDISRCCNGKKLKHKGFVFRFK